MSLSKKICSEASRSLFPFERNLCVCPLFTCTSLSAPFTKLWGWMKTFPVASPAGRQLLRDHLHRRQRLGPARDASTGIRSNQPESYYGCGKVRPLRPCSLRQCKNVFLSSSVFDWAAKATQSVASCRCWCSTKRDHPRSCRRLRCYCYRDSHGLDSRWRLRKAGEGAGGENARKEREIALRAFSAAGQRSGTSLI